MTYFNEINEVNEIMNKYEVDKCYYVKYNHELKDCLIRVEYDEFISKGTIITGTEVKTNHLIPHPCFIGSIREITNEEFIKALDSALYNIAEYNVEKNILKAKLSENLNSLLKGFEERDPS